MRAVVARVDTIVLLAMPISSRALSSLADGLVVLDHAVDVVAVAVLVAWPELVRGVGAKVHAGGVEPDEERLAGVVLPSS